MKKKQRICELLSLLVLFGLSFFGRAYTEEIPFIELQAVEPLTREERELKELRRFIRGLEKFLQEERIVVEEGIYIEADSVFEISRRGGPTPNLPFRVSIANATDLKDWKVLLEQER